MITLNFRWYDRVNDNSCQWNSDESDFKTNAINGLIAFRLATRIMENDSTLFPAGEIQVLLPKGKWYTLRPDDWHASARVPLRRSPNTNRHGPNDASIVNDSYKDWWEMAYATHASALHYQGSNHENYNQNQSN
jgi:hypothetical protein